MANRIGQLGQIAQALTRGGQHTEFLGALENLVAIMAKNKHELGTDQKEHYKDFHAVLKEIKSRRKDHVDEAKPIHYEWLRKGFQGVHYLKIANSIENIVTFGAPAALSGYVAFFQDVRAWDQTPTCDILEDEGCLERIQGNDNPDVADTKAYLAIGVTLTVITGLFVKKHVIPWAVREYNHFKNRNLDH